MRHSQRKKKLHVKSRTGCDTCKKRRIKCDEARPICARCVASGFTCEGYNFVKPWLFQTARQQSSSPDTNLDKERVSEICKAPLPSAGHRTYDEQYLSSTFRDRGPLVKNQDLDVNKSLRSPSTWLTNSIETRAIEFFHAVTKSALQSYNSVADDLFSSLVPKLIATEPMIQQQIVALSIAHESRLKGENHLPLTASRHYGKALRQLRKCEDVHLVLLSCLLLVVVETMFEQFDNAFVHLKSGLKILEHRSSSSSIDLSFIEPVFCQLATTASLLPNSKIEVPHSISWPPPTMPHAFQNVGEARSKSLELAHWRLFQTDKSEVAQSLGQAYDAAMERLYQNVKGDTREYLKAKLLRARFKMREISIRCQSQPHEMLWDAYTEEIRSQLAFCAELCNDANIYQQGQVFDEDILMMPGVFPILLQIGVSCRDPHLRRNAVELLRTHHQRCGHNDACIGVTQAELVIKLEEENFDVKSCNDVPAHRRVRIAEVYFEDPQIMRVVFGWLPYSVAESVSIPVTTKLAANETVRFTFADGVAYANLVYQGMIKLPAKSCMCKTLGHLWYQLPFARRGKGNTSDLKKGESHR